MTFFHRTDVKKSVSKAKFADERARDVKKSVAPPKSAKNSIKLKCLMLVLAKKYCCLSKNEMTGMFRNACCQSVSAVQARFRG